MIRWPLVGAALRDHRRGMAGWTLGLVALVVVQLSVYPTIRDSSEGWSSLTEQFPEVFKEMFRIADYASESGYLSTELFSFVVPFMFAAIGATWGARLATEDEENGTADIVLSLPVERHEYLVSRLVAAVAALCLSGFGFVATLAVGARILDMSIAVSRFVVATVVLVFVGLVFMSFALVLGAWTGRKAIALGVTTGLVIATFIAYSLAPLVGWLDALGPFNPMQWTIGSQPLLDGFDWGYGWRSISMALAATAIAFPLWARRDISA